MNEQALPTKSLLHDWIDEETRALDVVASWESLCETYDALRFVDPLSDTVRLEEYKWIIKEMNKFLTRIRSKLMSCKEPEDMIKVLETSFTPVGQVKIDSRRTVAYQKLRQRWISRMVAFLMSQTMTMMEDEDGRAIGWTEPGDGGNSGEPGIY